MLRQIVDEDRAAGRIFLDDGLQCRALWPLVGEDPRIDTVARQLLESHLAVLVCKVRQDNDVGMFGQDPHRIDGAGDRRLAMHFGIEETAQHAPDVLFPDLFPRLFPAHCLAEIMPDELEFDTLAFVEPFTERGDHVQQHLVAIADDQRTAHCESSLWAATRSSGATANASAQRTRSGSWFARNSSTDACTPRSPSPCLSVSGSRPVRDRKRPARSSFSSTQPSAASASVAALGAPVSESELRIVAGIAFI